MGFATSQQLARYYELYQNIDVTFTKEVIKATGLITQQIYIKALGGQWPCVINSTSFMGAKIIAGIKSGIYEKIQQGTVAVSLRFSFIDQDKNEPMSFFVAAKVLGVNQYAGSPELALISIGYTQRPPDDLIEKLGVLLEANVNSAKRREERIMLTPDAMRKIGIMQKETVIFIQGIPRRCILRDVSFSGAKVILVGIASFLVDKEIVLRIDFDEPRVAVGVKGKIVRTEDVEGRKDLVALALQYYEAEVPMAYKMHVNAYVSAQKKSLLSETDAEAAKAASAKNHGKGTKTSAAKEESGGKDAADAKQGTDAKPSAEPTQDANGNPPTKTE